LYRSPDRQRLEGLKRFGTLLEEERPEGVSAFYIGTFKDAASAADVLARVRLAGYPDAYVERVKP
jgi:cell division septation protein DedD